MGKSEQPKRKSKELRLIKPVSMIKHNIILVLRNFIKQKTNSIINLIGLTIAITTLLLIIVWINAELRFDRFHVNGENIYRIVDGNPADKDSWAGTPAPLAEFLKTNFGEVVATSRFDLINGTIKAGNDLFFESRIATADTNFFEIFSFSLFRGITDNLFSVKNAVLISESTASKYFGSHDPVGQIIILDDSISCEITGVFRDIPENSHIRFDLMIDFERIYKRNRDNWGAWNYFTYVQFNPGTNTDSFKEKTIEWAEKYRPDRALTFKELNYQPLNDIHFQFNRKNLEPSTEKKSIRTAMMIAVLILIIACINFTNLTTIQAIERAKEIAVRKIMGESRRRLVLSMIGESMAMSFLALFLSYIVAENLLPLFNRVLDSNIHFDPSNPVFIVSAVGLVLITGLLSGLYPAFILSTFKPDDLFRKSFRLKGKQSLRSILVVLQFSISIMLIISLIAINRQMKYMQSANLGMNPDNIVTIRLQSPSMIKRSREIREEIMKIPDVISASVNGYIPSQHNEHWGLSLSGQETGEQANENLGLWIILADKYFIETMEMEVIEGKDLINNYSSATTPFILNESAAKQIKNGPAVGREFEFFGQNKGKIIGLVKNFHNRSLHHKIEPAAIIFYNMGNQISVRIKSENMKSTLAALGNIWRQFSPDLEFDYYFMNEDIDILYKSEYKTNNLLKAAGFLSMFLCCMGIFGIVSYSAKRRSKEIGIRKVNGSRSIQVVALLSANYTWWILISFFVACPVAYYFLSKWLQGFAYTIKLDWWIFAAAGLTAYLIALFTAVWQSWKVANRDPVEALRYE